MKRFVFHGIDRPGAGGVRAAQRPAHADYHRARGNPVGGPLLDPAGAPCGTLIVFDAPDLATAEAVVADDPYIRADLFATTSVHEFHAVDWPQPHREPHRGQAPT